jgi:hypothetical protein
MPAATGTKRVRVGTLHLSNRDALFRLTSLTRVFPYLDHLVRNNDPESQCQGYVYPSSDFVTSVRQ